MKKSGFVTRTIGGHLDGLRFDEYELQSSRLVQRIVCYYPADDLEIPAYAVLRTKCGTTDKAMTVYDVEHLLCRGPGCLKRLVDLALAHQSQFEIAGPSSFFAAVGKAQPHYDLREPLEVFSA